ncbi:MAG: Ni/Fe hydrogenase subunit alpha [Desulfonatronovibrionaceae bacterium]
MAKQSKKTASQNGTEAKKQEGRQEKKTAAGPGKIEINHLTRVEGHGNIVVTLGSGGRIEEARWEVEEAPRFFEAMVQGRPYSDIHHIVSRICGICSIGHQLCSIQATEDAFHIEPSEQTLKLRKLALHAENLQSHLLHIGYLVLPDLVGVDSALALAESHKKELLDVIGCRRISNEFSELICGRTTHPQRLVPGGMEKVPERDELLELKKKLQNGLKQADRLVNLFVSLKDNIPDLDRATEYVALVAPTEYAMYRGEIGTSLDQRRPGLLYEQVTNEYCVPQSTAKWAKNMRESYMVGALARFNLNSGHLSQKAAQAADKLGLKAQCTNPYYNSLAQMVECVHSLEDSLDITESLLAKGVRRESPQEIKPFAGRGIGAVEVPRGILFHAYDYNENGRIATADCVIPTNQNHANIQADFNALAPELSGKPPEEIEMKLSMLVRGYDPCISCSTHMLDMQGGGPVSRVIFRQRK